MCIFKSLNNDPHCQSKGLDEEDFLHFYDVLDFKWTQVCCFFSPFFFRVGIFTDKVLKCAGNQWTKQVAVVLQLPANCRKISRM